MRENEIKINCMEKNQEKKSKIFKCFNSTIFNFQKMLKFKSIKEFCISNYSLPCMSLELKFDKSEIALKRFLLET